MPGAIGPRSRSFPVAPTAWRPGVPYAAEGPSIQASTPARRREITGTNDSNFNATERVPASCPSPDLIRGLSRASTSCLLLLSKQDVDGRDNPGHDSEQMDRYERNAP